MDNTEVGRFRTLLSRVRTDESREEGITFVRGLFGLGTGKGFTGGAIVGSIFHGETLSGRGMEEVSSQCT